MITETVISIHSELPENAVPAIPVRPGYISYSKDLESDHNQKGASVEVQQDISMGQGFMKYFVTRKQRELQEKTAKNVVLSHGGKIEKKTIFHDSPGMQVLASIEFLVENFGYKY